MVLRVEKDGRFLTFHSPWLMASFGTAGLIGGAILIMPLTNGLVGFVLVIICTIICASVGESIDNSYSDNDKKYEFRQGRTFTNKIASENDIKAANQGNKALFLCFDNAKNKYYWYFKEVFYSTKKDLDQEAFLEEHRITVGRISTHVYLINQNDSEMHKIGITNNVRNRFSSIKTANPNPLTLVFSGKVNDARALERELHSYFKEKKINREWFNLNQADIDYVIRKINENS